jgi:hypothetical protein
MFSEVVIKPKKQSVLVKIIIYDLFPEIDMQLIVKHPIERAFIIQFPCERALDQEVVPDPEIKIVALSQFIRIFYFPPESFFQTKPLHGPKFLVVRVPLHLLPDTVFRLRDIRMAIRRKMIDKCVTQGQLRFVVNIVGNTRP